MVLLRMQKLASCHKKSPQGRGAKLPLLRKAVVFGMKTIFYLAFFHIFLYHNYLIFIVVGGFRMDKSIQILPPLWCKFSIELKLLMIFGFLKDQIKCYFDFWSCCQLLLLLLRLPSSHNVSGGSLSLNLNSILGPRGPTLKLQNRRGFWGGGTVS